MSILPLPAPIFICPNGRDHKMQTPENSGLVDMMSVLQEFTLNLQPQYKFTSEFLKSDIIKMLENQVEKNKHQARDRTAFTKEKFSRIEPPRS